MIVSQLSLNNFRKFKCSDGDHGVTVTFHKGLNALIGENDSGKSEIIDAIKLVLLTQSNEYIRPVEEDFLLLSGELCGRHSRQREGAGASCGERGPFPVRGLLFLFLLHRGLPGTGKGAKRGAAQTGCPDSDKQPVQHAAGLVEYPGGPVPGAPDRAGLSGGIL